MGSVAILPALFPARFSGDVPDMSLPLFPREGGSATTKRGMTATIVAAARLLNTPLSTEDGTARISGHTLRPTGAQGLTRAGMDLWAVQLIGRWGSTVVQKYVREAAATPEAAISRRRMLSQSLSDCVADAAERMSRADLQELATSRRLFAKLCSQTWWPACPAI